jgi:hypothetical protein
MAREFTVIIEQDKKGYFNAERAIPASFVLNSFKFDVYFCKK